MMSKYKELEMAEPTRRTNILLIMTDQQRYDTLGCTGAPTCRTPHIDALAERGINFSSAYTPTSPCSPARAALFTGAYPHNNHVLSNDGVVNPKLPTLASELGAAGYNLGYAGKWHVDRDKLPSDHGFQGKDFPGYGYPARGGVIEGLRFGQHGQQPPPHYREYLAERGIEPPAVLEAHYGDNPGKRNQEMYALQSGDIEASFEAMVAEFTFDLLRQFAGAYEDDGKPFFLWTNFWGPHTPCLIPEPYYSLYDPSSIPVEPSFAETWKDKPQAHEIYERYWGLTSGGWAGWREIVARYWGYMTMIDDLVGRMLDELQELGLAEDTLVVYTTDHGDMMGAHRMIEKGPFAYEESWRLPLVAAHPSAETPGATCDEFVHLHDLFPTFLEAAGLQAPQRPDSASILEQILGRPSPEPRDLVYGAFEKQILHSPFRFVRTRTHKLVYNTTQIAELYNLENDPHEMHNLINDPAAQGFKAALLERMRDEMVRLDDPLLRPFESIRHVL
jgi:arylsulfatase A-like enzyme